MLFKIKIRILTLIILMLPVRVISHEIALNSKTAVTYEHNPSAWLKLAAESNFNLQDQQIDLESVVSSTIEFLNEFIPYLNGSSDLKLEYEIESPFALHLTFTQLFNGIPVYGSQIKVNISKSGHILSVFNKTVNTSEWDKRSLVHQENLNLSSFDHLKILNITPVIYINDKNPLAAYSIEWMDNKTFQHIELVRFNDKTLFYRDLNRYNGDSLVSVSAKVFLPNPISTADVTYGPPYFNAENSDVPELNAERKLVVMQVWYNKDTLYLEGPNARISEFSSPVTPVTFSTDTTFHFTRSHSGFEDVNAYYHIHTYREYIKSLGFENLVNFPIDIDAHALNGNDNSMFITNPPRLLFGTGGVNDAEDADIIIHEYGHAISHSAAPGSGLGSERLALEEGLADYLACSYARYLNENRWEDLFNWDGHNEFWSGRWCITNKFYPEDLTHSIYANAEIWAGTLMEIWGHLGREITDLLMINSIFSFASGISMQDAAYLFLQSDSLIFQKQHSEIIRERFQYRGFMGEVTNDTVIEEPDTNTIEPESIIIYSYPFTFEKAENIEISFNQTRSGVLMLTSSDGRKLKSVNFQNKTHLNFELYPLLSPGIYILTIITEHGIHHEKLIRF